MQLDKYSIKTEYDKDNNDPKSVLEATAKATGALSRNDQDGLNQVGLSGGFKTYMDEVEEGSLIIHLSIKSPMNLSRFIEETTVRKISSFLNLSRVVLTGLISRERLIGRNDLVEVAATLNEVARSTNTNTLQAYNEAKIENIAHRILELQEATSQLTARETLSIKRSDNGEVIRVPRNVVITDVSFKEMFVQKSEIERTTTDLVVKKLDLLGNSKWDFIYQGKQIRASIDDLTFISTFQQRGTDPIKPHDSLYVDLEILNEIGYDLNVINSRYHVKKVHRILLNPDSGQQRIDTTQDS
jgi:hypothetical protein